MSKVLFQFSLLPKTEKNREKNNLLFILFSKSFRPHNDSLLFQQSTLGQESVGLLFSYEILLRNLEKKMQSVIIGSDLI